MHWRISACLALTSLAAVLLEPSGAHAMRAPSAQVTTLYVFQGPPDAGHPDAGVIIAEGSIFGSTSWGGPAGLGAVYRLTPGSSGYTETVLHSFAGGSDGARPSAVSADRGGNLYGTTSSAGGSGCSGGCGTVFEMKKRPQSRLGYVERVLYQFQGGTDGSSPVAAPLIGPHGAIYGTTQSGGGATACGGGCGTVFRLTRTSSGYSESVLYRFQGGSDGSFPVAGLIVDRSGAFYGTTLTGGGSALCPTGCGTVFKLTPASSGYVETVLYRFLGGHDGAGLFAGVTAGDRGELFGTAALGGGGYPQSCAYNGISSGCGTVFKLSPRSSGYIKRTLYKFSDATTDGAGPWGGVTVGADGTLYGTTVFGGNCGVANFGCGTAYSLSHTSGGYHFTLLYSFPGYAAAFPYAGLLLSNGVLYGTSSQGGVGNCDPTSYACGTVFELTP